MFPFDDDEGKRGGEQMRRAPAQPSGPPPQPKGPHAQQQDADMETLYTTWSAVGQEGFTMVKGLGYEDKDAIQFVQVLEEKINEGQTEEWSTTYAMAKVHGKTNAEAEQFAKHHTQSPISYEGEGGGEQMRHSPAQPTGPPAQQQDADMETLYTTWGAVGQEGFTMVKGLGYEDQDAIQFVQVLEQKINEGHSEDWSTAYAMTKLEGKTDAQAEQFAEHHTQFPI